MYAKLQYPINWTVANMLTDIISVLTGTVDVNTLSANVDKPNSLINTSSRVAGWTVHDANAGGGAQVLTAPCVSGNNKYIKLSISGAIILCRAYESWNATTHTGVNPTTADTQLNTSFTTAQSFALHISASNRHVAMSGYNLSTGGANGQLNGVWEYVRTGVWDTASNAYPNFAQSAASGLGVNAATGITSTSIFLLCRLLDCGQLTATDVVASSAVAGIITPFGTTAWNSSSIVPTGLSTIIGSTVNTTQTFNAALIKSHQLMPWGAHAPYHFNVLGDISSLADMYFTTYNFGSAYDEVVVGGNTYVIWLVGGSFRMAVRKG